MKRSRRRQAAAAVAGLCCGGLLLAAVLNHSPAVIDLPARVTAALPASGIDHPVTAVLLNFRGYDTLLEIAVLLVAVTAGAAARRAQPDSGAARALDNPMLASLLHGLAPLMLLVAAYLLWAGAHRPGGAFQAGAVLAAAGVLLRLAGITLPGVGAVALRLGLLGGFSLFLLVAVSAAVTGAPFLSYPTGWAAELILAIEAGLSISIGFILLSLFAVAPPAASDRR